jgi:HlyD family secretion protein
MASNKGGASQSPNADISEILGVEHTTHRRRRFMLWGGLAVAIILAIIVVWRLSADGNSQMIRYKTAEVKRGDLTVTVSATGTLEPVNQVEVGSEISGNVRSVLVDFNDRVKKGQELAILDTDQLEARVNQAQAALALARAQVKQTEATVIETRSKLKRAKKLASSGMSSEEDRDSAQASYDRAMADLARTHAEVAQAEAALSAEQTTLAKATIHSPIDGIVLKRDVEPGQTVAASFQTPVLFTLAENLTQMELHVAVDEADVGQVRDEQNAVFTVDAYPDRSFKARITEIHYAPQTVDGVVTYETLLAVDNSDLSLRPGMTATADITVKHIKDVLLVPNAALRFSPPVQEQQASARSGSLLGSLLPRRPRPAKTRDASNNAKQQKIWILAEGQAVAVPVSTGATDGAMTEITSGDIRPGMMLITDTLSKGQ